MGLGLNLGGDAISFIHKQADEL